jgi:hypothetical protein
VVLAGYDGDRAYLSDTSFEELQATKLENLDRARHGEHPAFPLRGHMFTVAGPVPLEDLRAAVPAAIARAVREMTEPELGELAGLAAVRRLAAEADSWPRETEDWRWCARFAYQVIERRGTGGGNFRLMYSRFLAAEGYPEAELAARAAAEWTALAGAFRAAGEPERADRRAWRTVGEAARRCADAEERLWTELAGAPPAALRP